MFGFNMFSNMFQLQGQIFPSNLTCRTFLSPADGKDSRHHPQRAACDVHGNSKTENK